jgi:hypothetical protein
VTPLTDAKKAAIVAGLVSLLGGGVQASDISVSTAGSSSQARMHTFR